MITRVEVIDSTGRVFTGYYPQGVTLGYQDDDRTLKIFAEGEPAPTPSWPLFSDGA